MSILKYTPKEREAVVARDGFLLVDFLVPGWSGGWSPGASRGEGPGVFTAGEVSEPRMMCRASYNIAKPIPDFRS